MALSQSKGGAVPEAPTRLTVMRGGALGDFVVTLPAIAALRRAFPGVPLRLIGPAATSCLARPEEWLHADSARLVCLHTEEPPAPGTSALFEPTEVVVAYVADAAGTVAARLRALAAGPLVVHDPRLPAGATGHVTDHLAAAVEAMGLEVVEREPRLELQDAEAQAGRTHWAGLGSSRPAVAIHPGSGGMDKCWPLERFIDLAQRLTARGARVLVVQGPAEAERGQALPPGLPTARPAGILPLAGLLAHADLFVGNDSGPGHLAAAVNTPTLSLFGPTDPRVWRPRGTRGRVLQAPGGRLSGLGVDSVEVDALRLLHETQWRP